MCLHAVSLCSPMGCSPPGSSSHGIVQARILEWVAMPSPRGSSPPRNQAWGFLRLLHQQRGSLPQHHLGSPKDHCESFLIFDLTDFQWIHVKGFVPIKSHGQSHGRIPWTEELGGLQSIGLQRVGHDWSDLACTCDNTWLEKYFT